MAIRHHPEQTLSVHYFARSGDAFKAAVPIMRRRTCGSAVLRVQRISLTHQAAAWRLPLACLRCGATEVTATGSWPCRFVTGVNDFTHPDAGQGDRFPCDACNGTTWPDELIQDLPAKQRDGLVTTGALRAFGAPTKTFVCAEVDDKRAVGTTVEEALRQLVGKSYGLTQKLCRLRCTDPAHAASLLAEHHAQMPWRLTEITRGLEPVSVNWHHGRLEAWEIRKAANLKNVARVRELQALDDELEQIRRRRLAELT